MIIQHQAVCSIHSSIVHSLPGLIWQAIAYGRGHDTSAIFLFTLSYIGDWAERVNGPRLKPNLPHPSTAIDLQWLTTKVAHVAKLNPLCQCVKRYSGLLNRSLASLKLIGICWLEFK